MLNVFVDDLLIRDFIFTLPAPANAVNMDAKEFKQYAVASSMLDQLLAKNKVHRGDKISVTKEEFNALAESLEGLKYESEPGGSSADILTTLKWLMDGNINIDFQSVIGHDLDGDFIREDLAKTGIHLIAEDPPGAESATSLIFADPDGTRTLVTYPGTTQLLKPEMVTDQLIGKSDAVFLPVSLWGKFGRDLPEAILKKCQDQDKQLIVSIPRQARFNVDTPDEALTSLMSNADVIVGDASELQRIYKTGNDVEAAIEKLREDMSKRDTLRNQAGKNPRRQPAVAFITHSNYIATIITAASPPGVSPPRPPERHDISVDPRGGYTLGANDAAYAGFLAGYLSGRSPEASTAFAIETAKAKFLYPEVRIPAPQETGSEAQNTWNKLRIDLNGAVPGGMENASSAAQNGGNATETVDKGAGQKKVRSFGNKVFDWVVWPSILWIAVWGFSLFIADKAKYGSGTLNNWYDRAEKWLAPKFGKFANSRFARGSTKEEWAGAAVLMAALSMGGNLFLPIIKFLEDRRQKIATWIDKTFGKVPEHPELIKEEPKQTWKSMIKGRLTAIGTAYTSFILVGPRVATNVENAVGGWSTNLFLKLTKKTDDKGTIRRWADLAVFDLFFTAIVVAMHYAISRITAGRKAEKELKEANEIIAEDKAQLNEKQVKTNPQAKEELLSDEISMSSKETGKAPKSWVAERDMVSKENSFTPLL